MTAIDYVVRDGAGAIDRGVVSTDSLVTSISAKSGQEISLNLQQASIRGYARDGDNLVIELVDGRLITLDNYFNDVGLANRLFISSDGFLNEVSFVETADGGLYGQYGPSEQWGKWSPSDDLIFLGNNNVVAAVDGDGEEVSMLAAGLLGGSGLLGAGAAGLGALALASGVGGDGAAAEAAPTPTAEPTPTPEVTPVPVVPVTPVAQPAAPFVDNATSSTNVGGDSDTPHQLVVTGGGEPGDTVEVTIGGETVTTTIGDDGTFSTTFTGDDFPADGSHDATVVVTGPGGGSTNLDGPTFVIDTTAPEVVVTTGVKSTGDLFNADDFAGGVALSGTSEPGALLEVTISGVTQTTTVADDGSWRLDWAAGTLPGGEYDADVSIKVSDSFGNTRQSTEVLVVDTVTDVSVATSSVGSDGVVNAVEHASGVTVTGTAQPGASVVVTFGTATTTVIAGSSGAWSAGFASGDIPTGEYDATVTAVATDGAGNTATSSGTVRIDTVANAITIAHPIEGDDIINGVEASDGVTLTGTSVPGAVVNVTMNGFTHAAMADATTGSWSVDFAAGEIPAGTYTATISATSTDAAGNVNTVTDSVNVDTAVDGFGLSAGKVEGDNVINGVEQSDGTVVSGTVEAGSTVMVTLGSVTVPATVTGTSWTANFTAAQIATGEYDTNVTVVATDAAGNMANLVEGVKVDTFVNTLNFNAASQANTIEGDGTINAIEALDGVNLGGQVEAGSSVMVSFNGVSYPATVDESGAWSVAIPASAIAQGSYDAAIVVTATDAVGNVDSINQTVKVDTDAPDGPVIAAFTRDTQGIRSIQTEGNNPNVDVDQVAADGSTSDAPASDTFIAPFNETLHGFTTRVPDGSDLVVSDMDAAGNVTSTYLALDDENPGSTVSLASSGLTGYQIDAVDLQFAEAGTLTLTEADVKALSQTTDTLTVHGGADDTVQIAGATATGTTTVNGQLYTTYQAGDATLIIDSDITVEEPPVI